jgi:hypothetical protein
MAAEESAPPAPPEPHRLMSPRGGIEDSKCITAPAAKSIEFASVDALLGTRLALFCDGLTPFRVEQSTGHTLGRVHHHR